ncbi:hypothetical protein [Archangium lipolyticum]|uniref:hypothetical protein n=1 Tax=Archangium lipolyticum TaxID=2970465 RepID=UPI002149F7E0|nr:hypothetical protein [Archangium lipolyticum]
MVKKGRAEVLELKPLTAVRFERPFSSDELAPSPSFSRPHSLLPEQALETNSNGREQMGIIDPEKWKRREQPPKAR